MSVLITHNSREFQITHLVYGQPIVSSTVDETSSAINCGTKRFICVGETSFLVCYSSNITGTKFTIDKSVQNCPQNTFCDDNDLIECEATSSPTDQVNPGLTANESVHLSKIEVEQQDQSQVSVIYKLFQIFNPHADPYWLFFTDLDHSK